ncbi:MAG: alpha/beta hydrolase [Pseudomonadota bacterium]
MQHLVDQHTLINGRRIAHGVLGQGEPVVLMHGTPSSSLIWRDVAPALATAGYRVHVYDLLGFGLSERPRDPATDTSVSAQVPVLTLLLDTWGLDTCHLIAHDIGGAVATQLALKSPERVRSLTLIDVVSFDSWPSPRTRAQMQAGLDSLIQAPDAQHRAHFREWLLSAVHNTDKLAATALDTYLDFISGTIGQASLFQHQIRHYDAAHTAPFAARYAELGQRPTQILWGADDAWQVVDWAHKLHAAIPGSELHIMDECGHFAMEDQPDQVLALLQDFLLRQR